MEQLITQWFIAATVAVSIQSIFFKKEKFRLYCPVTLLATLGSIGAAIGIGSATVGAGALGTGFTAGAIIGGGAVVGSAAAGVAGPAVTGIGSIMGIDAQKQANQYNAQMMQQQADIANIQAEQLREQGVEEKRRHLAKVRQLQGTQAAMFGASGATIGEGSSYDLMSETASQGVQDAMTLKYNKDVQAWGAENQSQMYNAKANLYNMENENLNWAQGLTGVGTGLNMMSSAGNSAYKFFDVMG